MANLKDEFLKQSAWTGKIFNGDWVDSIAGTIEVTEPGTGETMATVGFANQEDVNSACVIADAVQQEWANLGARERANIFFKAATILQENFEEIATYVALESGGIIPKGQHEVNEAVAILHNAAHLATAPRGEILQSLKGPDCMSMAKRVPRGVVGIISPFNFPLVLSMRAVAPALACGNTVVIKPDPQTPVGGGFAIARALEDAGLPKGVFHVLPGAAEAGEALCTNPLVQMIQFTGSTAVGRRVGELAGHHLKKVSLELGGTTRSSFLMMPILMLRSIMPHSAPFSIRDRSVWPPAAFLYKRASMISSSQNWLKKLRICPWVIRRRVRLLWAP